MSEFKDQGGAGRFAAAAHTPPRAQCLFRSHTLLPATPSVFPRARGLKAISPAFRPGRGLGRGPFRELVRRPGHLDELVRQLQTTIGPKLALVTGLKKGAGKEAAAVLAETLGLFAGTADAALEAILAGQARRCAIRVVCLCMAGSQQQFAGCLCSAQNGLLSRLPAQHS